MKWPCKVTGNTTRQNGRKMTVNATIEGAGDTRGAVLRYMLSKRNSWEWYGCEVTAITPLGQRVHVLIEPLNS